jgi:multidrug transporter EmrE-like cation transporter
MHDRLLARLPQPENLAAYREEVESMLAKNTKAFRREKWVVCLQLFFAVAFMTFFFMMGDRQVATPRGIWLGTLAFVLLLYALVDVLKHFINRSRVEILKEVKQVQLQVLELQASLQKEVKQ